MSPSFVFLKKVLFHLKIIVPVSHLCFLLFFLLFFSTQLYQKYLYCILDIFLVYHFNKLTKFYNIIGLLFVLFLSNLSFFSFFSVSFIIVFQKHFVCFFLCFVFVFKEKEKGERKIEDSVCMKLIIRLSFFSLIQQRCFDLGAQMNHNSHSLSNFLLLMN